MSKYIFIPDPDKVTYKGQKLSECKNPEEITNVLKMVALERIEHFLRCNGTLSVKDWQNIDANEWELVKQAKANIDLQSHIDMAIAVGNTAYANELLDRKEGRITNRWSRIVQETVLQELSKNDEDY